MPQNTKPLAFIIAFGVPIKFSIYKSEMNFANYLSEKHPTMLDIFQRSGRTEFAYGQIDSKTFLKRLNIELNSRGLHEFNMQELTTLWQSTYSRDEQALLLLPKLAAVAPLYYGFIGSAENAQLAGECGLQAIVYTGPKTLQTAIHSFAVSEQ